MNCHRLSAFLGALLFSPFAAGAESPAARPGETREQRDARMAWWREARFGMFIHWGVYAVPAGVHDGKEVGGIGEWIMNRGKIPVARYREYAKGFNPVKYDPEAWVKLAKDAGMRYVVITSKHHDGFALFDSKVTDWDVVDSSPYQKDLLKPFAEACRKQGMKLGFYYSQAQDWVHTGGAGNTWDATQKGSMDDYLKTIAVPQLREILSNYGDVAVLWFDTPRDMTKQRAEQILPILQEHPALIWNNRLGGGYHGDTDTPEQHIPAAGFTDRDWETCMTMNHTWGFKSKDHQWKSAEDLVRNLIDIASKGGNYLLNIGPTAEGEIPAPSVDRLKQIGSWMRVNGEAIHGTSASPFRRLPWGRCTVRRGADGDVIYLHVFNWPADGKLVVPGLAAKVRQARALGGETVATTTNKQGGITLAVGPEPVDPLATVVALEVDPGWAVQAVTLAPGPDGSLALGTDTAELHQTGTRDHMIIEAMDGKKNVGFWTNPANRVGWGFRTDAAASYEVLAEVSSEREARAELVVDGGSQRVTFPPSGAYREYHTVSLGEIKVGAGDHEITIKPDAGAWVPVNIRALTLKPAAGSRD